MWNKLIWLGIAASVLGVAGLRSAQSRQHPVIQANKPLPERPSLGDQVRRYPIKNDAPFRPPDTNVKLLTEAATQSEIVAWIHRKYLDAWGTESGSSEIYTLY